MIINPGLQDGPIYLDYNATTPVDPAVVEAMLPYLSTHFGNPSSSHYYGQLTHRAIDTAREQVAHLIGCLPGEIIFTGGGSESDNLAIRGATLARRSRGDHIITQVTEHPAVLNTCRALARLHGFRVTYLPVDSSGRVSLADVEAAIEDRTVLITIMLANNETGTLQPITEITQIAQRRGVLVHTDAAKGIGALYVRRGLQLEPVVYGGGQEAGLRAGTENVAYTVALGSACMLAQQQLATSQPRLQHLRDLLQAQLEHNLAGSIYLNGHETERLPNTLNISVEGVTGEEVLAATPQIASSTGSACHEGNTDPSPVLMAMGLSRERALGALRLTLGRWSTVQEVKRAAILLARTIDSLRQKR